MHCIVALMRRTSPSGHILLVNTFILLTFKHSHENETLDYSRIRGSSLMGVAACKKSMDDSAVQKQSAAVSKSQLEESGLRLPDGIYSPKMPIQMYDRRKEIIVSSLPAPVSSSVRGLLFVLEINRFSE